MFRGFESKSESQSETKMDTLTVHLLLWRHIVFSPCRAGSRACIADDRITKLLLSNFLYINKRKLVPAF
jgi:hypothetical protein